MGLKHLRNVERRLDEWRRFETLRNETRHFWQVVLVGRVIHERMGVAGELVHAGRRYFEDEACARAALVEELQRRFETGYYEVAAIDLDDTCLDGSDDVRKGTARRKARKVYWELRAKNPYSIPFMLPRPLPSSDDPDIGRDEPMAPGWEYWFHEPRPNPRTQLPGERLPAGSTPPLRAAEASAVGATLGMDASRDPVLAELPTNSDVLRNRQHDRQDRWNRLAAKEEARARARHDEAVAEAQRLLEESARARAQAVSASAEVKAQRKPKRAVEPAKPVGVVAPTTRPVPPTSTVPVAPVAAGASVAGPVAHERAAVEAEVLLEVEPELRREMPTVAVVAQVEAVGRVPSEVRASTHSELQALPSASPPAREPASPPASVADRLVLLAATVVATGTALVTSVVWWFTSGGPAAESQPYFTWSAAAQGFGMAAPALVMGCLLRARPLRTETTRWVERACYLAGLAAFALGAVGPWHH